MLPVQVFYVILQFLNAQPEAVRIQRKTVGSSEWKDWQFLAKNCSYFGMEDNGALDSPDSVNCLQLPRYCTHTGFVSRLVHPQPLLTLITVLEQMIPAR